jgi:hypothetical protein
MFDNSGQKVDVAVAVWLDGAETLAANQRPVVVS